MAAQGNQKIISAPKIEYNPHPGGMGCAFFEKMREHRDKVAQIDALTGATETFGALLQKSVRIAISMRSKSIAENDIVTFCSLNNLDIAAAYIATLFLGAIPSAVDPSLLLRDTVFLLKQVKPKMIFVGTEGVELVENTVKQLEHTVQIIVFGETSKYVPISEMLKPNEEEKDFRPVPAKNIKDTAIIMFSSGTSGLPKGICLHHYGLLYSSYTAGLLVPIERVLPFSSFYWVSSPIILTTSILHGTSRVVVSRFAMGDVWRLFHAHNVTFTFMSPNMAVAITKLERPKDIKKLDLKLIIITGAPISENYRLSFEKLFAESEVMLAYGQTEMSALAVYFKIDDPKELEWNRKKPNSCGTIIPGFSFKFVDTETEELLGPNEKGEIRIKSDFIMREYYNMDSSEAWDKEGWLRTGDVGYYDEDRCIYIVDRIKDMLKFHGFQISPTALEALIVQHPRVERVIVIGIPNDEDGDHPMALVVPSTAPTEDLAKDIEKFVEERASDRQKLRAGVKFIKTIPLTPTGKIKRKDIRDSVLKGLL